MSCGGHGDLVVELGEGGGDGDGVEGGAGEGEEGVGREAGAGAVGAPLVLEEAGVGVEVGEFARGRRGRGRWCSARGRAAGVVLRPEAVEDEGDVLGALGVVGGVGVGDAELGRPGEVEEVVVEGGVAGCSLWVAGGENGGGPVGGGWLLAGGVGGRSGVAAGQGESEEEGGEDLLHGFLCSGAAGEWRQCREYYGLGRVLYTTNRILPRTR